ncbi:MAG: type IV secretion system protein [Thermoleophilia bacterium]|nr:type IV secretion system protein [Thermoleophilia bacterium]
MRRRIVFAFGLVVGLLLVAAPLASAASDIWGNVAPASTLGGGGLFGRYPLDRYGLDQHFTAVSASLTGGVDVSGVPPMIAYFLASVLWALTSFLANTLISLFAFAFSLDLLNGSAETGGAGALEPVSRAIHSIYSDVFGAPWLVLAISVVGIWAMWRALVQRRYSETAGTLALSLIYVVVALFFVAQPAKTIGSASEWTNRMSVAFLSVAEHGSPSGGNRAKSVAADRLFELLVLDPWVVLNFGGTEHCAKLGTGGEDSDPESVAVRPLSSNPARDAQLARRLASGTEITADGKLCVNNASKYAARFLRHGPGSDERDDEYEALNEGDASGLDDAERSGYRLGVADRPATDAMEQGGQYQRLLIAIVVFVGELGAFLLLGSLAVGIILAQVLLLLLLAFAPVALVAAAIPGRGHRFFRGWLEKLAGYLLRKAAYSLILAVVLAVNGALAGATSQLGWLMSFGLQALFFWAVFLQRRNLSESLVGIATGPGAPGRDNALRLVGLYAGARTLGRPGRGLRRAGGAAASVPARGARGMGARFGGGRETQGAAASPLPRAGTRSNPAETSPSKPKSSPAPPERSGERRSRAAGRSPGGERSEARSSTRGEGASSRRTSEQAGASAAGKRSEDERSEGRSDADSGADKRSRKSAPPSPRSAAPRNRSAASSGEAGAPSSSGKEEGSLASELRSERERRSGPAHEGAARKTPKPEREAEGPASPPWRGRRQGGDR